MLSSVLEPFKIISAEFEKNRRLDQTLMKDYSRVYLETSLRILTGKITIGLVIIHQGRSTKIWIEC